MQLQELPLAKAGVKQRVCGDRAKSGTHQWLLMMRTVVAEPPRQEQRQEKLGVAKGAVVPHLCSAGEDFGHRMLTGIWDSPADTGRAVGMGTKSQVMLDLELPSPWPGLT